MTPTGPLVRNVGRLEWMEPGLVLGELGWADTAAGRRTSAERMRARAVEELQGAELAERAELRRGWCLGRESFRERMLGFMVMPVLAGQKVTIEHDAIETIITARQQMGVRLDEVIRCFHNSPSMPQRLPHRQPSIPSSRPEPLPRLARAPRGTILGSLGV